MTKACHDIASERLLRSTSRALGRLHHGRQLCSELDAVYRLLPRSLGQQLLEIRLRLSESDTRRLAGNPGVPQHFSRGQPLAGVENKHSGDEVL